MRPWFLVSVALLAVPAPTVLAAVPGMNLGWSNCATGPTSQNRTFACDTNDQSFTLVGSWIIDYDVPDFVGIEALIDCHVPGGLTPWLAWQPGGCRDGELTPRTVGTVAGCVNPYAGANQGGDLQSLGMIAPDRYRYRLSWYQWSDTNTGLFVAGDVLYTGFLLGFSTQLTVDEGAGSCPGCSAPACFVLSQTSVYTFSLPPDDLIPIASPHVRNWCSWQAETGFCPGATPSRPATWGEVKALYR